MMDAKPAEECSGCGRMIVVVGPSGAGKDTLMARAAEHFRDRKDLIFARRVITRDGAAGGEEHDSVCEADFLKMQEDGRFAVSWSAHGLHYGIPVETLQAVKDGRTVVANGSRSALGRFKSAYPSLAVINVVARPDVLASRLAARGRESEADILQRLQRSPLAVQGDYDVTTIDNSGSLVESEKQIIDALARHLEQHA